MKGALTHLETTERELVAQHADAVARVAQLVAQLAATRVGIAALRKAGDGLSGPVAAGAGASDGLGAMRRGHAGAAAATARSQTVLRLLRPGAQSAAALRDALPVAPGASAQQHRQGVANTLTRLKDQGLVVNGDDGWTLTARGRKAAGAAKEEP